MISIRGISIRGISISGPIKKKFEKAEACLLSSLLVVAFFGVVGLPGSAHAEQIKISDVSGSVRAMAFIPGGARASVQVRLAGDDLNGIGVYLHDAASKKEAYRCVSGDSGFCLMENVAAGSYGLSVSKNRVSVSDVSVLTPKASSEQVAEDGDKARTLSRAMYVAGASAIAGVVGFAASSGGSSSAGGTAVNLSGSEGGVGLGDAELPVAAASKPESLVGTSQIINPAPGINGISPAPSTGSTNSTPPPSGPGGPTDSLPGGSPSDVIDSPDAPGGNEIAPAPDLTEPMTPS